MAGYNSIGENAQDYILYFRKVMSLYRSKENISPDTEPELFLRQITGREKESDFIFPLRGLCECLALSPFEFFCLALALCCELDGALRNEILDLTESSSPTFDLAAALYTSCSSITLLPEDLPCLLSIRTSKLRFLFRLEAAFLSEQPLAFTPLRLRYNVIYYLTSGRPCGGYCYSVEYSPRLAAAEIQTQEFEKLKSAAAKMANGQPQYVFLSGKSGSGKRTLVLRTAQALGVPCIMLECRALETMDLAALYALACELTLDTLLSGGLLCVHAFTGERLEKLEAALWELPLGVPVFLLSDKTDCHMPSLCARGGLNIKTGPLCLADFKIMCDCLSGASTGRKISYHRLLVGQMCAAWLLAGELNRENGEKPNDKAFTMAVRELREQISMVRNVETSASFDSLVLENQTLDRLHMLCKLIRYYTNPDFQAERACGRGITALFYGPSGTGKTLAASALANTLGLELLQIDLSRVLDKYIGETEKHLSEVFSAARERNCILFFDEADALFGRRTEVSSSHDRYANSETAFLLQEIEAFDGVVLLATNLFKNFDEAFLRRIDLIIRFSMPDEPRRLRLWELAFYGLKLEKDIDLCLLAANDAFSPAIITRIGETARVLCGRDTPLTNDTLNTLLENELEKKGRRL